MLTSHQGDWGERRFASWCSRAGLTANRVQNDLAGWDYLVEAPPRPDDQPLPLGLRSSHMVARVQVKTTNERSVGVKLTNWLAFTNQTIPAFFCIIRPPSPEEETSPEVLLVEVDNPMVTAVFDKLAQCGRQGNADLAGTRMSIPLNNAILLEAPRHTALRRTLAERIQDPEEYRARRNAHVKACQASHRSGTITFHNRDISISADKQVEAMVDHVLGLTESIEVNITAFTQVLLGESHEGALAGPATIRLGTPAPTEIGFIGARLGQRHIKVPVEITTSTQTLPFLETHHQKIRFDAGLFHMVYAPRQLRMTFRVDGVIEPLPLPKLHRSIQLLQLLSEQGTTTEIELCNGKLASLGQMDLETTLDVETLERCSRAAGALHQIGVRAGHDTSTWMVPYSTLFDYSSSILKVADVLAGRGGREGTALCFTGEVPASLSSTMSSPAVLHLPLGQFDLMIGIAFCGTVEQTPDGFQIRLANCPPEYIGLVFVEEDQLDACASELRNNVVRWFDQQGLACIDH